ncbi:synaptonemal complex central element protein 2-like [Glandiceps talaboti]
MENTNSVCSLNNFGDQTMLQEPERPDVVEQSNPIESAALPDNEMSGLGHVHGSNTTGTSQAMAYPVTSREMLQTAAQTLIEDINAKRKRDTTLLTDFKKNIEMQVSNSCGVLEQTLYQTYQHNGTVIQEKLQELFAILDRIATLEAELDEFKHALGLLYKDISV